MELVRILAILRARWPLVLAGLLVAALAGAAAHAKGGQRQAMGLAEGRLLLGPRGAAALKQDPSATATLVMRASLLADLAASDEVRNQIAAQVGLAPAQLAVMGPSTRQPKVPVPLAVRSTEVAGIAGAAYLLTLQADTQLPVLTLDAAAPVGPGAGRVVSAATEVLRRMLERSDGNGGRLTVQPLGPVVARTSVHTPSSLIAVAAALMAFLAWCCGIVLLSGPSRHRRMRRIGTAVSRV